MGWFPVDCDEKELFLNEVDLQISYHIVVETVRTIHSTQYRLLLTWEEAGSPKLDDFINRERIQDKKQAPHYIPD